MPTFRELEKRVLDRWGLDCDERLVELPTGRARALVTGDGPPVVLVPGGAMPAAAWAPLVARLEGFRTFALELPGFGLGDPVPFTAAGLRPQAVAFLDAALAGLGLERAAFVGNSMGALWAFWLALERPARVTSIATLGCPALLLDTSAPAPMRLMSVRTLGRLLTRLGRPTPERIDRMLASAGVDLSGLPELRDLVVELQRLPPFARAWPELLQATLRLRGSRPQLRLGAPELRRISQPVQLVWGRDDPFGPASAGRRAAALLPQAELHVVPGGHGPWLPDNGDVARLVGGFLGRR